MHADIPADGWMDAACISLLTDSIHQGIQFNIEITASSFIISMELKKLYKNNNKNVFFLKIKNNLKPKS